MEYTQEIPFCFNIALKLAPTLVTLVVGSLGTYIAFNQYRTNRDKLRLDLFEKRLEAYEKLQEFFNYTNHVNTHVDDKAMSILREADYRSRFLFGDDITEHIKKVLHNALERRSLQRKLMELPIGEERDIICDEESRLFQWNCNQQEDSPNRYAKYLKFM